MSDYNEKPTELTLSAAFQGGRGISPYHVDCSSNSMDIRPAADIIINRIHDLSAQATSQNPLVVLMGEEHTVPAHIALQQLVISRLHDSDHNFIAAFEQPHNLTAAIMRSPSSMNLKVPANLFYRISDCDMNGALALESFLGFNEHSMAPVTSANLMAVCHERSIRSCFNDAAMTDLSLDQNDPDTRAAMEQLKIPPHNMTGIVTADGLSVRNLVMAQKGLAAARAMGARIIIQRAGLDHIFGGNMGNRSCPYEHSLCSTYSKAGATVLPVFPTIMGKNQGVNVIPYEAATTLSGSVIIDGLHEGEFFYGSRMWVTEESHLEAINRESGEELELTDSDAIRKQCRPLALATAREILRRHAGGGMTP